MNFNKKIYFEQSFYFILKLQKYFGYLQASGSGLVLRWKIDHVTHGSPCSHLQTAFSSFSFRFLNSGRSSRFGSFTLASFSVILANTLKTM